MPAPSYPADVASMTPEWFSLALAERFPGVRVAAAAITQRIDGTATKLRYSLEYATPGDRPGAPDSLWVKGAFDPRGARQGEAFANEVRFFLDLAPHLPIDKPDCYHGAIEPVTRNGLILLEDLLLRGATFGSATRPLSADQAAGVLSLQARYHAAFWMSDKLDAFPWLKAGGAIAEADMVDQYFGLWDTAEPLPRFAHVSAKQRDKERVKQALKRLMAKLRREPICLVHGDSHAANLFFGRDGRPAYLDWQHLMRGNWAFDLANFMVTSLSVADRRANERALLSHYLLELAANGATPPRQDEAWREYRSYAIWPFMWVMCPDDVHPEAICTLNAERACTAIEDLESIECLEAAESSAA